MERRQSEALSDVLRRFMRESGLESPLNQYRVMNVWAKVVGDFAARQTSELFIRNQTLYVRLSSPALKSDLMMTVLSSQVLKAAISTQEEKLK